MSKKKPNKAFFFSQILYFIDWRLTKKVTHEIISIQDPQHTLSYLTSLYFHVVINHAFFKASSQDYSKIIQIRHIKLH